MEISDDYIDPEENEPAILNLSVDKKKLLEKRGLFPTASGLIDDTYYITRKEIKRNTHLQGLLSVHELTNMSLNEMERVLYKKDSVIGMEVISFDDDSSYYSFGGYKRFYDVDPLCLEPYIAKYVRAINRGGMKTFFSCDGWHNKAYKSRELVIRFTDRYSWIWHKVLCKLNNIEEYCCWEHRSSGKNLSSRILLPRADEQRIQIYNGVLLAADVFVQNTNLLKGLKDSFLLKVDASEMDELSDTEVEERMREFLDNHF